MPGPEQVISCVYVLIYLSRDSQSRAFATTTGDRRVGNGPRASQVGRVPGEELATRLAPFPSEKRLGVGKRAGTGPISIFGGGSIRLVAIPTREIPAGLDTWTTTASPLVRNTKHLAEPLGFPEKD